ncbi:restriction endonuclease subunit S [Streptomyces subrutilus]|uniref:restriction endonuclease subunit S n=1 Tax=Streptomyces subrutilus TaxID=36818 RepID=UPI002E136274|nr:restriction endonuclease subunit S [Streptomyces subrutilus]
MQTDDGVQWIPVSEVGEVRMGKQLSPASRAAAGQRPYLRVANVLHGRIDYADVKAMGFSHGEHKTYGLRPGDILLNEGQSLDLVGRSAIYEGAEGEFCFQNTLVRFRPGSQVVSGYAQVIFERWLATGVFAAIAKQTTSIAHLGGERFASLRFPLRSLVEQRRIVEVVDAVSKREHASEATIAKLRSVRRGVLLAATASIGDERVPEGWARVPLRDVVPKAEYGISEALDQDSRGVPVLRMNNIGHGRPELSDLRYSPVPVPRGLELRHGDVLFNRTNSIEHIGKSGMWREEIPEATFASYLVRINPDATRLIPEYLIEWLMHPLIRQRVRSISTVAVQQVNVNPTRLRDLEIDMPIDVAAQRRIVDSLHSCDEQIEGEQAELSKLRTLKQGLVDDLLAGRV